MINLLAKCYIVVPVILFVVTCVLVVHGKRKLHACNECEGIIVGFREYTNEWRLDAYLSKRISPLVSYCVGDETYTFEGHYCSTAMRVGQTAKVLYHKDDPSKATVKVGVYVAPYIVGGLAILSVAPLPIFAILLR